MKIYVTKWVLTQGILELEVGEPSDETPNMVYDSGRYGGRYFHKGEWHRSRVAAVNKAEEMRDKKIKSLEKQMTKLIGLHF